MSIISATTTIQPMRALEAATANAEDRGGDATYEPNGNAVRAHIDVPGGSRVRDPSGSISTSARTLLCDPCDLLGGDRITDLSTGQVWLVDWAQDVFGWMPYTVAGLSLFGAPTS